MKNKLQERESVRTKHATKVTLPWVNLEFTWKTLNNYT